MPAGNTFNNLIGQEHFEQQFQNKNIARHVVCDGKRRIKTTFILHCFKEKQMIKIQNNLFWGPFGTNLGKNEFSTKITLRHFLGIIVPSLQIKNQKKLMSQFWKNLLTKRWTYTGEMIGNIWWDR